MLAVYSCINHYKPEYRYSLNNIIKALWNNRSQEERVKVYGDWILQYRYEEDICAADVCLLTNHWNYYLDQDLVYQAQQEFKFSKDHGKYFVIFSGGDHPAHLPFEGAMLFESAGYRSAPGLAYHSGFPSFIKDYLQIYCGGELQLRQKLKIPVVGFCGQASLSALQTAYRTARNSLQRLQYRLGLLKWPPAPFETSSFRRRVLRQFENLPSIHTNYLLRQQYRAGDTQDRSDHHPARLDFIRNILDSDYTVCMRGGGNFSVRFYETLALGRIPIFIDSDCLLPFPDRIDYKSLFPWISLADLPRAAEIVADYHASLSEQDFIDRQIACRKLWEEHFIPNGFYRDLKQKLNEFRKN